MTPMSHRTVYIKPQPDRNSPVGAMRLVMHLIYARLQLIVRQRLARPFEPASHAPCRNRTYNLQNQCADADGRRLRFQGASDVAPRATQQAFTAKGRTSDRNETAIRLDGSSGLIIRRSQVRSLQGLLGISQDRRGDKAGDALPSWEGAATRLSRPRGAS